MFRGQAAVGLSKSSVGALSEMFVSVDLLSRGFEVFRALAWDASCDLALVSGNKILRVEVKTGKKNDNTGHVHWSIKKTQPTKHDVLAVVLFRDHRPSEVLYYPPLPENPNGIGKVGVR